MQTSSCLKKIGVLVVSFTAILFTVAGCDENVQNCGGHLQQNVEIAQTDPSLISWDANSIDFHADNKLRQLYQKIYQGEQFERCRYVADFNYDGIMDLALSEPMYTFGTGGGSYTLYIGNADGSFKKLCEHVFGGIMSLKMRKAGKGILYVGSHCGGGCLSVAEYSVSKSDIKKISSKTLYVGDYDNSLQEDNEECDRIFNDSDTLIRQYSKTTNVKVFWLTGLGEIKSIDKLVSEMVIRAKAGDKKAFTVGVPHLGNDLPADYEKRAEKQAQKLIKMILASDMANNYRQHLEYIPPPKAKLGYGELLALLGITPLDCDYEVPEPERVQMVVKMLLGGDTEEIYKQHPELISPPRAILTYDYPEKDCCFRMEFEKIEEYGTWRIEDIWFCR